MTSFTKNYSGKKAVQILQKRILMDGYPIVVDLKKSKGSYLFNQVDKKYYLDFYSFFGTLPIGFNHPGLKNKAYQKALIEAAQIKPALSDVYSEHYARFVDVFDTIALRKKFLYFFFVEGGSVGVENALKVAFDWKTRLNFKNNIHIEADKIIHFEQCFHGRTGYTLSLTDSADPRKTQYFPKFPWPRISVPKVHIYPDENIPKTVEERESLALKQIQDAFEKNPNRIAAIIIEPLQSEGGGNHFRNEFLQSLRKIADEKKCLLIFDEVQTGLGLSGKWWYWEHTGVYPDIMTFGKKIQVCGLAASSRLDQDGVDHCFKVSSRINSTFGGNLADMVRATRYIELIQSEKLLANIQKQGKIFIKNLEDLAQKYPLQNVRGVGGLISFDVHSEELQKKIIRTAEEKMQLLILPCGRRGLRFRPSLSLTPKELADGMDRLEQTLCKVLSNN